MNNTLAILLGVAAIIGAVAVLVLFAGFAKYWGER